MNRFKKEVRRVINSLRFNRWSKENDYILRDFMKSLTNFDYSICLAIVHQAYSNDWKTIYGSSIDFWLNLRAFEKASIRNGGTPPFTFDATVENIDSILKYCRTFPCPRWECVEAYFDLLVEVDKVLYDNEGYDRCRDEHDKYYCDNEDDYNYNNEDYED